MKIIVYDFEIFPLSSLLGTITIHENGSKELFQTWDPEEIKHFYYENVKEAIWVSHNGLHYDQLIYQEILKNRNPYSVSKQIIDGSFKGRSYLQMMEFDCMKIRRAAFSLKLTELISGRSIETTEVDFDLPRELNLEEKELTEKYNKADLEQTLYNFQKFYQQFELRINIGKTFNIPIRDALRLTEAQLGARVFDVKRDDSLKYKPVKPKIWSTLQVKNQELLDWYLSEEFMNKKFTLTLCGCELTLGVGGIHGSLLKTYWDKLLYADVGGFYNRIMILLDLFPRSMSKEAKERYKQMFKDQLEMKKDPTKKNARKAFKTILLSIFGAMNQEFSEFYDPYHFYLVTLSGQLFIIDLLEKLDGIATGVNINTDGLMIYLDFQKDEEKVRAIIKEWEDRTGFEMEVGFLYKMFQRDVNAYFCLDENGEVDYKGEVINYKTDDVAYGSGKLFDCNNPPIIAKALVDYLLFDILPEETVEMNKKILTNFQYQAKKGTYSSMTYDTIKLIKGKTKKAKEELVSSEPVKPLNRAFAAKIEYDEEGNALVHTLVKHKTPGSKGASSAKVANLPDSIFIYNEDITDAYELLKDKINYQYYIDEIYKKVLDYIPE